MFEFEVHGEGGQRNRRDVGQFRHLEGSTSMGTFSPCLERPARPSTNIKENPTPLYMAKSALSSRYTFGQHSTGFIWAAFNDHPVQSMMDADPTNPTAPDPSFPILWRDSTPPEVFHSAVWTRVFNGLTDSRLPRAVVNASSVSHVVQAVKLAKAQACQVSVRSGGHSWAAWSVRDDAILIDLVGLNGIQYDEETKVARVGPAMEGSEVNAVLAKKGRFFPGGHCPCVGIGGFLLQGGMGWNAKVSLFRDGLRCECALI